MNKSCQTLRGKMTRSMTEKCSASSRKRGFPVAPISTDCNTARDISISYYFPLQNVSDSGGESASRARRVFLNNSEAEQLLAAALRFTQRRRNFNNRRNFFAGAFPKVPFGSAECIRASARARTFYLRFEIYSEMQNRRSRPRHSLRGDILINDADTHRFDGREAEDGGGEKNAGITRSVSAGRHR